MMWALLWAAVFLVLLMTGIWLVSERIRNAGIVDIAWAGGFAPLAWLYFIHAPDAAWPRLLFCGMVTLWALRLAVHLGRRVARHYPVEDARYTALRQRWDKQAALKMLEFFYLQALLMLLLSLPFWLVLTGTMRGSFWIYPGFLVWIIALVGESVADAQLDAFKADPKNRGQVCSTGLWRYSRHPNYFFEWLIWISFFLYSLDFAWGWITIYVPALMLFFLLFLTGIKATEEQALKTKGEAYRRYQQTTSSFIPWFPQSL